MPNGARAMAAGKIAREAARALTSALKRRGVTSPKTGHRMEEKTQSQTSGPQRPKK
jgi:hypothetical protein